MMTAETQTTDQHELCKTVLRSVCSRYFVGLDDASVVNDMCVRLISEGRLNQEDMADIAAEFVHKYTETMSRPYVPSQIDIVSSFISAFGIDYELIDRAGVLTSFVSKMIRHFTASYFTGRIPLHNALSRCRRVLDAIPVSSDAVDTAMLSVIDKAVGRYMSDNGTIPADQLDMIDAFISESGLDMARLPHRFACSHLGRLAQIRMASGS